MVSPVNVNRVRLAMGLTQAQFAQLLRVPKRTVEQWETGNRKPTGAAVMLLRVAELEPDALRRVGRAL